MSQSQYEQWGKMLQEPLRDLTELNIKTMQSLSYVKPEDFTKITKPDDLLTQQVHMALANSQKTLDYIEKTFGIMQKALLGFLAENEKNLDKFKKQ